MLSRLQDWKRLCIGLRSALVIASHAKWRELMSDEWLKARSLRGMPDTPISDEVSPQSTLKTWGNVLLATVVLFVFLLLAVLLVRVAFSLSTYIWRLASF
jgi:hypothetical protein